MKTIWAFHVLQNQMNLLPPTHWREQRQHLSGTFNIISSLNRENSLVWVTFALNYISCYKFALAHNHKGQNWVVF